MDSHPLKIGTVVNVINRSGRQFVLDGKAEIIKLSSRENTYFVRYLEDDQHDENRAYERYVDPQAQGDKLDAYLESLNENLRN